jgi:DNA mismatch repair protein MSH4
VSATLDRAMRKKKSERASLGIVVARKRRLLLNLKEHLTQAKNGSMDDGDLTQWLKDLRREFVVRMSALEEEERALRMNPDGDDDDGDGDTTSQGQGTSRAISTAVTDTEDRSQ